MRLLIWVLLWPCKCAPPILLERCTAEWRQELRVLRDWHNFHDRDSSGVARNFFWRRGFALTGKESYLES